MMGEVGRVYAVYTSGDVMVVVKGKSWVFNPLCLSPATEDEGTTDDDNPCKCHLFAFSCIVYTVEPLNS